VPQPARLSAPALEVLAIISYRQPIGRVEIEDIRGVGSSGVLRTLTERNLVEPVARGEGLGRPLLYGTTKKFLEHFGFRSLEDLPRPDELPVVLRERRPEQTLLPLEEEEPAPAESAPPAAEAASDAAAAADTQPQDAPSGGEADLVEDAGEAAADDGEAPDADVESVAAEQTVHDDAPSEEGAPSDAHDTDQSAAAAGGAAEEAATAGSVERDG
jgi:pyruvate/2-oxoglutarate dehydrogenase complex dihydrolipoamide acyltransferase (E2) component